SAGVEVAERVGVGGGHGITKGKCFRCIIRGESRPTRAGPARSDAASMTSRPRAPMASAKSRPWRRVVSALLAGVLTVAGPGSWTTARAQGQLPALGDTDSADFSIGTE